ncbi:C4-dicarboxylate ABC transporter substrate-binding protein [Geotalea uraniireducens]|uniref:C4-dicarboxylate ABC transporter substrate-binding protein n=1 Tax=Geotalea uraniireducens TaxID=351604 RepID=A0ABM8EM11_9BACT|nr:TAXI family TRAP transporter solute-binding subunit [Geotalea uraniireducens]BDV43613.1 C4-dicarboxylate ABC transporter substrate-binding protein [Geotalea uraniireducens]
MKENIKILAAMRPFARFTRISLRDLVVTVLPVLLVTAIGIGAAYWLMRPAPPNTLTITAGPTGSTFQLYAKKYQKVLAQKGIKLKILPSNGSLENLDRLLDPAAKVDVGFVQGGLAKGRQVDRLFSLGSVFHEPLALFYRSAKPLTLISQLAGKRLAIGPEGSGTRAVALELLKANGIGPDNATLLDLSGEAAAWGLVDGTVDAAFLMGDSATPGDMRSLIWTPGVHLYDFVQAEAYSRRYPYLNQLVIPMGALDFGQNIPGADVHLLAPTVELVARDTLHPALSDLLIEAAKEVHGRATLLQSAGEFPAPVEHEYRLSDDAKRYYTSGKKFLYRSLPFWLATLVDRFLVLFVPVVVLFIPGLKLVPALYSWRIRSRIYRWYGLLISIERTLLAQQSAEERTETLRRLDEIEAGVNGMKIPLAYADQFYVLRDHIRFVRERYAKESAAG